MIEIKYRICSKCSRIVSTDFKNPIGKIFLNDLVGRSSKSIHDICDDCQKKEDEREEIINSLRSARAFPVISEDVLLLAKTITKNRHK